MKKSQKKNLILKKSRPTTVLFDIIKVYEFQRAYRVYVERAMCIKS